MSAQMPAKMDEPNRRFIARLLRLHLRSDTMPPGWSHSRFAAACREHGVTGAVTL